MPSSLSEKTEISVPHTTSSHALPFYPQALPGMLDIPPIDGGGGGGASEEEAIWEGGCCGGGGASANSWWGRSVKDRGFCFAMNLSERNRIKYLISYFLRNTKSAWISTPLKKWLQFRKIKPVFLYWLFGISTEEVKYITFCYQISISLILI